jgi:hypothetical protein
LCTTIQVAEIAGMKDRFIDAGTLSVFAVSLIGLGIISSSIVNVIRTLSFLQQFPV